MPCYNLICSNEKCREKVPEAIVSKYLDSGDVAPGHPCPKCGKPMKRTGGDLPAHMVKCWAGYNLKDF